MSVTLDQFVLKNYQQPVQPLELESLAREQVFFNVKNPPPIPNGGSLAAEPNRSIVIPLVQTPRGAVVVFYTTSTDSRLGKPFAGVPLGEAVEIARAMTDVVGLMLQSSSEPALAIEKANLGATRPAR